MRENDTQIKRRTYSKKKKLTKLDGNKNLLKLICILKWEEGQGKGWGGGV